MTHLPLPSRCLTLLPPWPQAIRYAEKRLENRSYSVGKAAANWRYGQSDVPIVGLSQSKTCDVAASVDAACRILSDFTIDLQMRREFAVHEANSAARAATLWLCAEIIDVLPPDKCEGDPWHVPGQWGLILGRVWEVKPVPCTGGQGLWTADKWCARCGHIYADSAKPALRCYSCKAIFPECLMQEAGRVHLNTHHGKDIPRLQLEIVTEVL